MIGEQLYVADRRKWRRWPKANHNTFTGIWLVYHKKTSGRPRIAYNDAVEEALCFGWIGSTVNKLDDNRYAQRFSPRKPGSKYSQANKERLRQPVVAKQVVKDVLAGLGDTLEDRFVIPKDILRAIKANKAAWPNFRRFSRSYNRSRVTFIEGAPNRPHESQKRLIYLIERTEKNKKFSFGGIEKHY